MMSLWTHPFVFALIGGAAVFIVVYLNLDRVLSYLQKRGTTTESEVVDYLEKMLADVDRRRIRIMLGLISYGLGAIFFLLFWPNVIAGALIGFLMMLLGWMVPKSIVRGLWESRCTRIVDQMVDGLTMMTNSIRAGQSITQAMERVVENYPGPLAQEFNLILNKVRLGMSVEEALVEFAGRIPRQDVQMLVTAITVLKETGGNLAETFATISSTIRERQKVEKKIQAMTAQGQMQAIIVSAVPFVLILMFFLIDPNYILPMFTKPMGWLFLGTMLGLQTIGLVMMKRIVTIKV